MANKINISISERFFSALSYLTAGWAGLLICVIYYFLKKRLSRFLSFNIFQSIFISLLFFVLCMIFGLAFNILSRIPFIQIVVSWIQLIFMKPVLIGYSLIQVAINLVILYTITCSLFGKIPKIYWVSNIIKTYTKD